MDPIFPFKILQKIQAYLFFFVFLQNKNVQNKLKNTHKPHPPTFSFVQGLPGDKGQPGSPGEAGPMVRSSLSLIATWLEQAERGRRQKCKIQSVG